ncbi:hypothetical protein DWB84_06495 [Saccharophagus sp. K07]|nr:hypothetical protein [Saccharophagus sp. K07]
MLSTSTIKNGAGLILAILFSSRLSTRQIITSFIIDRFITVKSAEIPLFNISLQFDIFLQFA